MSRFYIRVYKDDARERTWGCGSRSDNNRHLHKIEEGLLVAAKRYQKDPNNYFGTKLGEKYRFELIKNRHGEKQLYREVEVVLHIPRIINPSIDVHLIKCKDITHITEDWDPRVLVLPPDW